MHAHPHILDICYCIGIQPQMERMMVLPCREKIHLNKIFLPNQKQNSTQMFVVQTIFNETLVRKAKPFFCKRSLLQYYAI